jgi:hypothetical protein
MCFPIKGNEGRKYLDYSVMFIERKKGKVETQVRLEELTGTPEFEGNFPHTVGFFRDPVDVGVDVSPVYLEIRIVRSIEEFWKFLNDVDI